MGWLGFGLRVHLSGAPIPTTLFTGRHKPAFGLTSLGPAQLPVKGSSHPSHFPPPALKQTAFLKVEGRLPIPGVV